MARLYIIRGTPGSGKSTFYKDHLSCYHVEADMYFMHDEKYDWKPCGDNHEWCQEMVRDAMRNGIDVCVSNTFTTMREVSPYLAMSEVFEYDVTIIKCVGRFKNTHGCPTDILQKMTARWEDIPGEYTAKQGRNPDAPLMDCLDEPKEWNIADLLRKSCNVRRKELSDGIVSYNYTTKAFFGGRWDLETKVARGLFMRGDEIVARSFNKFFRIGEVAESSIERIFESYDPAHDEIRIYRKWNGYLGILSFDRETGRWFSASKSTDVGGFADRFRQLLARDMFTEYVTKNIKDGVDTGRISFVFEVIDNEKDPHFVMFDDASEEGAIRLIAVFDNTFESTGWSHHDIVAGFGDGIKRWLDCTDIHLHPEHMLSVDMFRESLGNLINSGSDDSIYPLCEGYVIEIRHGDLTISRYKVKTAMYCFWKYVRGFISRIKIDEVPDWGKVMDIKPYTGNHVELVYDTPLMHRVEEILRTFTADDIRSCMTDDLLGHKRLNMLKLMNKVSFRMPEVKI